MNRTLFYIGVIIVIILEIYSFILIKDIGKSQIRPVSSDTLQLGVFVRFRRQTRRPH